MTQDPGFKYNVNDHVMCFQGPLIYNAKILQRTKVKEDEVLTVLYLVHYQGWSKRYDEWVDDSRLQPVHEESLALQKRLEACYATKSPPKKTTPEQSEETNYLNSPEIRLDIPEPLKCQLVDDWENISKTQQLVPLPRSPTINQMLALYRRSKMQKNTISGGSDSAMDEVLNGLKMYFNKALGTMLLYRFERQQYADIRKTYANKDMTDVYGCEHLLRLYVQLPKLIAFTDMTKGTVDQLKQYLEDVLKYMLKMQKQFFITEYQNASPNYVTMAGEV
ncbi:MRG-domain-containing protein [Hesseltinella vesiculosa]|uniref:Chromatin modification-related protein EAF3 n=1 Tax=Hesseltinella vesiculosa TaxID=101127 RepID=A0A1X2GJF9_9FUNG|nr:MRG-domain-containing protein [Hesseltinella vesiculosa]